MITKLDKTTKTTATKIAKSGSNYEFQSLIATLDISTFVTDFALKSAFENSQYDYCNVPANNAKCVANAMQNLFDAGYRFSAIGEGNKCVTVADANKFVVSDATTKKIIARLNS